MYNTKLSTHFRDFGKELEDIYKSHLENTRKCHCIFNYFPVLTLPHTGPGISANIDSARGNLAGTFVNLNAFVNAGFGNDKLMVTAEEGSSWIYKNKDHGT
jgi:26S proteasome regulatory subunit N1